MAFLKLSEIIQIGHSCLPTFGHLFLLLLRVTDPKLVVISLLALKWQLFKVEALVFSSISLHKKRKKSMLQLWRTVISRLVEISLPYLAQESLAIRLTNDQKLVGTSDLVYDFWQFQKSLFVIWLVYGVYGSMNKGVNYLEFEHFLDEIRDNWLIKERHPAAGWKKLWNILWHKINLMRN